MADTIPTIKSSGAADKALIEISGAPHYLGTGPRR
jgi:hypothetical protein